MQARQLDTVWTGHSAAIVVNGEPGQTWPDEFRVSRVTGAESDADLPYAGLHQLCAQFLDQVERLSPAQRDTLGAAFEHGAAAPDPSAVGLAVFSLLAHAAEERPLVCLIQHAEWLDRPSRQVLAVASRRLAAEAVAPLFEAAVA